MKPYMKSWMEKWGWSRWCLMQKNRLNSGENCAYSLTLPPHIINKPWISHKNYDKDLMTCSVTCSVTLLGRKKYEEAMSGEHPLWGNPVDHGKNVEWIMKIEKEFEYVTQQGNINITKEDVSIHLRKMPNWKATGLDGLHGFWLKNSFLFTWQW